MRMFLVTVAVPLLLGIAIYFLFRRIQVLGTHPVIDIEGNQFFSFLAYNVPDGLWLFSFLSAIQLIWNKNSIGFHAWIFSILFVTLFTEVAQYYGVIPGTPDVFDIVAYTLSAAIFFLIRHYSFTLNT